MDKNQIIFKNRDARLIRDILPGLDEKPMVVYHFYIREGSKSYKTYTNTAIELGYVYMDTDEYNGTYMTGDNYDHYCRFV